MKFNSHFIFGCFVFLFFIHIFFLFWLLSNDIHKLSNVLQMSNVLTIDRSFARTTVFHTTCHTNRGTRVRSVQISGKQSIHRSNALRAKKKVAARRYNSYAVEDRARKKYRQITNYVSIACFTRRMFPCCIIPNTLALVLIENFWISIRKEKKWIKNVRKLYNFGID